MIASCRHLAGSATWNKIFGVRPRGGVARVLSLGRLIKPVCMSFFFPLKGERMRLKAFLATALIGLGLASAASTARANSIDIFFVSHSGNTFVYDVTVSGNNAIDNGDYATIYDIPGLSAGGATFAPTAAFTGAGFTYVLTTPALGQTDPLFSPQPPPVDSAAVLNASVLFVN